MPLCSVSALSSSIIVVSLIPCGCCDCRIQRLQVSTPGMSGALVLQSMTPQLGNAYGTCKRPVHSPIFWWQRLRGMWKQAALPAAPFAELLLILHSIMKFVQGTCMKHARYEHANKNGVEHLATSERQAPCGSKHDSSQPPPLHSHWPYKPPHTAKVLPQHWL